MRRLCIDALIEYSDPSQRGHLADWRFYWILYWRYASPPSREISQNVWPIRSFARFGKQGNQLSSRATKQLTSSRSAIPASLPCILHAICHSLSLYIFLLRRGECDPPNQPPVQHTKVIGKTLPRIVAARKENSLSEEGRTAEPVDTAPLPTTKELLSDPLRSRIIAAGFCLAFFAIGFDPLFALWNYTPIPLGGLGREAGVLISRPLTLTDRVVQLSDPRDRTFA